jgi:hypothetical protein
MLAGHAALCQDKPWYDLKESNEKDVYRGRAVVSGLLSGCNQLTQYSVSEQELTRRCRNVTISPKISVCRAWRMPILNCRSDQRYWP